MKMILTSVNLVMKVLSYLKMYVYANLILDYLIRIIVKVNNYFIDLYFILKFF